MEDLNAIVFNVSFDFALVLLFVKFVVMVMEILLSTPTIITYYGIADIAITLSRMSVGVYISKI